MRVYSAPVSSCRCATRPILIGGYPDLRPPRAAPVRQSLIDSAPVVMMEFVPMQWVAVGAGRAAVRRFGGPSGAAAPATMPVISPGCELLPLRDAAHRDTCIAPLEMVRVRSPL